MRFYVSPDSVFPERNTIEIKDKKEIHHIRDVMRLKEGAEVEVFDGEGRGYCGAIREVTKGLIAIEIRGSNFFKDSHAYKLTLFQAIPKKGKMDFIVEKAVELGVDRIVPMVTERTSWAPGRDSGLKVERWRRICKAAGKQCGRTRLPVVSDIKDFNLSVKEAEDNDLVIFAALDNRAVSLRSLLKDAPPKNIAVFVGPEGDFSHEEIAIAKERFHNISSLGSLVLRVETATIYILSCLDYQYGI